MGVEQIIQHPVLTTEKYKNWIKDEFGVDTPINISYLDDGYVVQDFGSVRVTLLYATTPSGTDLVIIDCVVLSNGFSYRGIEPSDIGL